MTSHSQGDEAPAAELRVRIALDLPTFEARTSPSDTSAAVMLATGIGKAPVIASADSSVRPGEVVLSPTIASMLALRDGAVVSATPTALGKARTVEVTPLFPLTVLGGVAEEVKRTLASDRIPAIAGIRFRSPFRAAGYPGLFEIARVDVEGADVGLSDPRTRVLVVPGGHTHSHDHAHAHLAPENGTRTFAGYAALRQELQDILEFSLLSREYMQLGLPAIRGVLLYGPPGVGKTQLARTTAQEFGLHVVTVDGAALAGGPRGAGEATLREAFQDAVDRSPSLVLLDEADAIAPSRGHLSSQSDYRLVAQLLTLMDGFANFEGALVVATSNRPDAIDPALRRPGRLDMELGVGLPDRADRLAILQAYLGRMPLDNAALAETESIAERTHGYVAADLLAVCQRAGAAAVRRALHARRSAAPVPALVSGNDLRAAQAAVQPSLLRGSVARRPELAVADLGPRALAAVEKLLARIEECRTGARLLVVGAPPKFAAQVSEAIAARLEAYLLESTSADLLTAWFGETEAAVRDLFTLGRLLSPAVVHLRNVQNLAPAARDIPGQQLRRISDQLSYEVEHSGSLHVIASCLDAAEVDPALRSAFDVEVEF